MNQLIIKLTGAIQSSNFDEWKNDLIAKIQSTNLALVHDEDFIVASNQVKSFKFAEKSLKLAKQSAIDQAAEIQQLFSALDAVSEEARQARLSLERQIKTRKIEIKNQHIQMGIEEIQNFIGEQIDELKYTDKTVFLDPARFESAVSGKTNTKGLQNGIDQICGIIKREISDKAAELFNNKAKIEALPEREQLLFQDWKSLINLSDNEIDREIDKRISLYKEEIIRKKSEKQTNREDIELNPEKLSSEFANVMPMEKYRIVINLVAAKEKAIDVARSIKTNYGSDSSISDIRLSRNHDD